MESSSVRKIYVDSRRKTPGSVSSSDFEFELNRAITLPRKCVAFVTDIHLPHSWYNVDEHAQYLYVQETSDAYSSVLSEVFRDGVRRIELAPAHHTGTLLASVIETELQQSTVHAGRNTYDVTYSSTTGKIEISLTNDLGQTYEASLASSTGTIWKVYNGDAYSYDEALQRTGALTYSYVAGGFVETLTVSGIDPINKTFTAVTSAGNTYEWNNTLERLENVNPSSNWNWRPQFTLQFQQLSNYFSIYTDHQLSQAAIADSFAAAGISLNPRSPTSINHLLRHEGHGPVVRHDSIPGNLGSFLTGVLDLTGQSPPLFIVSPNMTAFGTSQGPLGEHTIMRCICPNDASYGGFGGHIIDTLQNEQDYFVCGGSTLKNLRFQLITITGQSVNLNGADWSFSIIFQDTAT